MANINGRGRRAERTEQNSPFNRYMEGIKSAQTKQQINDLLLKIQYNMKLTWEESEKLQTILLKKKEALRFNG